MLQSISDGAIHPLRTLLVLMSLVVFQPSRVGAWIEQDVQFSAVGLEVFSLDAVNDNVAWALAGDIESFAPVQEFAITTNGGGNWIAGHIDGAAGLVASSISALDASTAWVAYGDPLNVQLVPRILKTTNGGATWTHQSTAFPTGGNGAFCDAVHAFDSLNGVAIGDPHDGYFEIYTTTNGGTNWLRVPESSIPAELPGEFGLIPGPSFGAFGSKVWFGTNKGRVFRSTDMGATWSVSATGLGETTVINDVAFRDASHGLATGLINFAAPTMARTTDGGLTWGTISPPGSVAPVFLSAVPGTSAYVLTSFYPFGGGLGSAFTFDDGSSWTAVDAVSHGAVDFASPSAGWSGGITTASIMGDKEVANPPDRHVPSDGVLTSPYPRKLSAALRSANISNISSEHLVTELTTGGMWKWSGTTLGISGAVPVAGAGDLLSSSYPNPFNPAATIEFVLSGASHVNLSIYNSAGAKVRTLVNEELGSGQHLVPWRAEELASGVYFYRIETPSGMAGGRMVLAK